MTDKEKLKEIKKLADAMYYAAFNLTTDASLLRKAMNEYHQFVIHKYCKEEPVSEDFEEALAREWKGYNDRGAATVDALEDNTQELAFAKGFYRGAKWQKEKDFQYIKKECERVGSCCDEDIAIEAQRRHPYYYTSDIEAYANIGFKEGAMWQKQQDQETIELAEDHAMLAGMEKMKEQMMAKAVDGDITFDYYGDGDKTYGCIAHNSFCLEDFGLKDRDKVKVIVIKEDLV